MDFDGLELPILAAATKIWRPIFDDEEKLAAEGLDFRRREQERRAIPRARPTRTRSRSRTGIL